MALRLVTPPTVEPLSPADVRDHARIETTEDELLVARLVRAARRQCETQLGRALITQTWRYTLDAFPAGAIVLPYPPLVAVTSVVHYDDAGAPTTVAPATYYVRTGDGEGPGGSLAPVAGAAWPVSPATRAAEGVAVTYTAGYGDDPDDVPEDIRTWIAMRFADLYRNRETTLVGATAVEYDYVGGLLDPYRVRVFA